MSALKKAIRYQLSAPSKSGSAISLILVFGLFLGAFLISPQIAFAADPEPVSSTNYKAPQNANYAIENLLHSTLCEIAGTSPAGACLATTVKQAANGQLINSVVLYDKLPSGGALGAVTGTMVALFNPPTSTAQYLAKAGERMGILRTAYAQTASVPGSGAGVIDPVLNIWQVTRNIAYLGFIVIFLVVGLMIMFRQKINPQTVISAQQALPSLIIGLILVTFSYFIAAFIIDFSFIGTRLVAQIFVQAGKNTFNETQINDFATQGNILQMFWSVKMDARDPKIEKSIDSIVKDVDQQFVGFNAIPAIIMGVLGLLLAVLLPGVGWAIGGAMVGTGVILGGAGGGGLVGGIVSMILPAILVIALLIQAVKLFIGLLTTYIQLLIMTAAGPLLILASSIPGRGGAMSMWLKSLVANSLVFPAVFAAFMFAGVILGYPATGASGATPPLFGNIPVDLVRVLIAYGIILGTPSIPDMVRQALGVKGPEGYSQAALGGFMGGFNVASSGAKGGYGFVMQKTGLGQRLKKHQEQEEITKRVEMEREANKFLDDRKPKVTE